MTNQELRSQNIQWTHVHLCVVLCVYIHTCSYNDWNESVWIYKTLFVSSLPNSIKVISTSCEGNTLARVIQLFLMRIPLLVCPIVPTAFSVRSAGLDGECAKQPALTIYLQPLNTWKPCSCSLPAGNPETYTISPAALTRGGIWLNLHRFYSSSFSAFTKKSRWFRSPGTGLLSTCWFSWVSMGLP